MYSREQSSSGSPSISSGTVPLPPNRSTSSLTPSLSTTPSPRGRKISLPTTTEDVIKVGELGEEGRRRDKVNDAQREGSFNQRGQLGATRLDATGSGSRGGNALEVGGLEAGHSGAMDTETRTKGGEGGHVLPKDWANEDSLNGARSVRSPPGRQSASTLSNTISTTSSRWSYSTRPSHQFFHPTHSREASSSTSLPSSQLHFPLPLASGSNAAPLPTIKIRPRTSSLSLSRTRTPSNGSTASSASSDFPVTPALPASNSSRRKSLPAKSGARDSEGTWSSGLPVLGGASPGRGPAMVDPRFTFPRTRQQGISLRQTNQSPLSVGPLGEVRRTSEDKASPNEKSFIASLGSLPFLDSAGHELPLFSTAAPNPVSYLPTSPLQPAFTHPPSPFSPTSPVASISTSPPRPLISTFLPNFASTSPTKSSRKSPSTKRRSTSFSRRVRRRSSPRKPASLRRTSSSSSPHCRQTSRSSSLGGGGGGKRRDSPTPRTKNRLRHRSRSVPDLRSHSRSQSVPTPIPFDTFSPRSPYAHERTSGSTRRPSIADELLFGDSLSRSRTVESTTSPGDTVVFPSRRYSTGEKGKGRTDNEPKPRRSRAPVPAIPSRTTQPRISSTAVKARRKSKEARPLVKGSLMVPHPRLVVSDAGEGVKSSDEDENSSEAMQRRYREGSASDGQVERINSIERRNGIEDDQESIDHSSVLRVLRENKESRKERENWSDSATKTLGLGLGVKLAEFERRRSTKGSRGPGNIAFGGGTKVKQERRKARKDVEKEKWRAADSGTDGEGGTFSRRKKVVPEASPPMPHSFEPFVQLGRKLSLSRTKSREVAEAKRRSQVLEVPSPPRTVRGKPIRHLRTSPSVDSIFSRTGPPPPPISQNDPATEYGQALSFDENVPLNEEHRRPSLTNQNAFLSLPPHLHHLLRSPERTAYEPSRIPPPIPASLYSLLKDSNRLSTSSVASVARLSLALENQLLQSSTLQSPAGPGTPTLARTNARTPEITESRLNRSTSTPALLCDSSPRSSPEQQHTLSSSRNDHLHPHTLSPLPEMESPESQRSTNSHSDASSGLNVDIPNSWNQLFFSPPRQAASSIRATPDPTVAIVLASDDESSTEGTDDTFSIRRLERARRSLEALFPQPTNPELAQETLLLPSTATPQFSRTNSSAQESFVTAREAPSDGMRTPNLFSSRPLPSPAQTPWASTSFAREYLDGLEAGGDESAGNRLSDPVSLADKRASSRASENSYIDFDNDEEVVEADSAAAGSRTSPLSFLDDFSPPSSAPPSPAIASFPTFAANPSPPADTFALPLDPVSLPTSPTTSSTFGEEDSNRFSRLPTNRDSHLSVDSKTFHISPTSARFVNRGSSRIHSYHSSASGVLGSFPVPPVEEEETGSSGAEDGDTRSVNRSRESSSEEPKEPDHRPDPTSPRSSETFASETSTPSASSSQTVATTDSPSRDLHHQDRPETSNSFLDVSDASDNESNRWSRGTFRTFYSGSKHNEPLPPLPSSRY